MATNYQERTAQLEVVISDLKLHLPNYDKKHNPALQHKSIAATDFDQLQKIEKFIISLDRNKQRLFERGQLTPLGKHFLSLKIPFLDTNPLLAALGQHQDYYSTLLRILFEALYDAFEALFQRSDKYQSRVSRYRNDAAIPLVNILPEERDSLNDFVAMFRARIRDEDVRDLLYSQKTKVSKRHNTAEKHLDGLFTACGKLTFICLDLAFIPEDGSIDNEEPLIIIPRPRLTVKEEIEQRKQQAAGRKDKETSGEATPCSIDQIGSKWELTREEQAQEFLSKLFRNGKNHQALRDLAGYFQKWEYTRDKGFYSRCIFAFPASAVKNLGDLIEGIHDYWNDNITDGKGCAHNAKLAKEPEVFCQTQCTIAAEDEELIQQFKERVLLYMTHSDLYYKPHQLSGFSNVFNRSENKVRVLKKSDDQ